MVVDDRNDQGTMHYGTKGYAGDANNYMEDDIGVVDHVAMYRFLADIEKVQLFKSEVNWLRSYKKPDRPVDVVMNFGCGINEVPHLKLLRIELLKALNVDFVALSGPTFCCGRAWQRSSQSGDQTLAQMGEQLAVRSMNKFESWNPSQVLQVCTSCQVEFDYQTRLRAEERGLAPFKMEVFSRFLLDRLIEMGDDIPWKKSLPRRVMLHVDVLDRHDQRVKDASITLLNLIPGVEFVGMVQNLEIGNPCARQSEGISILNDLTPEEYRQVQDELHAQADALGADMLVTDHFNCTQEWSKFASDRLPSVNQHHLVAEALGISIPDRYQTLFRLGDLERMVEHSRPYFESWDMPEERAREVLRTYFIPKYASEIRRCPCMGECRDSILDPRVGDAACSTSWDEIFTRGHQLPVIDNVSI